LVRELQVYRELMTKEQATRFMSAVSKLGKRKCEWRPARCQPAPASDCASTCPDGQASPECPDGQASSECPDGQASPECSSSEGCVYDDEEAQDCHDESGER
jgi:hypothetical protein